MSETLDSTAPGRRTSTGTLTHGLSVEAVLGVSSLAGARVLAGHAGLDRVVQRLNVMEVPDVLAWVKPHELLLTTGYPLRDTPQSLAHLVADLDDRGLAAMAIKLGRYLDELPPEMVEQADRLAFPLILLPGGVGFDDILNQVLTDILNRQAATLARAEEAHRALVQIVLGGGGLAEVAAEVAGLLDVSVAATDADGRVITGCGPRGAAADWTGVPCFDAAGRLVTPDRYGAHGSWAVVPVKAGGYDHGRLVARTAQGELCDTDVSILERAATVAALVITKQLAVTAVESKYRADFLRDVITGRAGGDERVAAHAAAFGWKLSRTSAVIVAELDGDERARRGQAEERLVQDRLVAACTQAARRHDVSAAVAGFSHEAVVVVGAGTDPERVVADACALFADHPGARRTFSAGISRFVAAPSALAGAYDQATTAVRVGRQLNGAGASATFDALGVYRLLSLVPDTRELRNFVTETLGDLAGDDPDTADLRHTLDVLLETNLNVAETARRLHFHYNTLRYRIAKLERALGPFTADAHLRLNLTLALHVLRMRGI
jgi:purine catabolism regulator